MYLFFSPLTHALAIVGLVGCVAALLLIDLWFQQATGHARNSLAMEQTGGARPLLFWATALTIGVGVVFLVLFLFLSTVLVFLSAIAL
jgi:hypothetical protein